MTQKMSLKAEKMNFWLYSYTILLMLCKGLQAQTIMPPSNHGHGFEFSSYSEVVTNALYLYRRPLDSLSADHSNVVGRWIFPFMNFTCSYGRVIKLMFVAKVPIKFNNQIMFVWPEFFLWRRCEYDADGCRDGWLEVQTLSGAGTQPILVYVNGSVGVYEMNLTLDNSFETGDILGVYHPIRESDSQPITVLYQIGGAYSNIVRLLHNYVSYAPVYPYIAIETDESCAVGFLNRESLFLIVDTSSSDTRHPHLEEYLTTDTNQSMPLNKSGHLEKIVIAAKLNHDIVSGWPILQIMRKVSKNSTSTVDMTMSEPRPTGYLNVYEYDTSMNIEVGDMVHIQWPAEVVRVSESRYLLAYLTQLQGGTRKPLIYINVSSLSQNQTTTVTIPDATTINFQTGADATVTNNMFAIVGGVLFILVVVVLLAVVVIVIIMLLVMYQRKSTTKQSSNDNYAPVLPRSSAPRILNNPSYFQPVTNTRSEASENEYIHDISLPENEQGIIDGVGAQPNVLVSQNNPQDDYYYYKLYEWGVFVPTVDQREAVTEVAANSTEIDVVYSTLGESQYSTLHHVSQAPKFFEESEDYWIPASDEKGLYEQLSSKKYREILRNRIQLSHQLGSGQFGNVMKGVWLLSGGSKDVAVKILKEGSSEEDKVKFIQEAAINGQFWHPNIVKLMGVVTVGEPTMIVFEYLSNGDLRNYLMKMKPIPGEMSSSTTPHTLLRFCKEIASGMKYLERKKFVHRDLAARNILLSEEKTCKISDFGLSRGLDNDSYYVSRGGMIPAKWTAPEALHYKKYSSLSDVWSFGCVVYEIWSLGHKPFEGYTNREVIGKVDSGFRLSPPPGCPRDIYHIMIQCWHPNKNLRPSFSDLHTSLSDHALSLQMKESPEIESDQLHPQANTIGAPLEAGKELFTHLQNTYLNE